MLKEVGYEILNVEEYNTEMQKIEIAQHYCFTRKLIITGNANTSINTPLPLTVEYRDWQDNPLPENRPINISVTGPGQPQNIVLTPTGGKAEFDFVSEVAGTFKIRATAEFPCDPAEIEVVVS